MSIPTNDWFTFVLTVTFTAVALVGVGYTWRGRAEALLDLQEILARDIDGSDRLIALRNLRAKKKRLLWWVVLVLIGLVGLATPVRTDAGHTILVLGYLDLPARFLRDAMGVAFVVWEASMMLDDREDNKSREQLARVIRQESERAELAKATGGRVGGLRVDDPTTPESAPS